MKLACNYLNYFLEIGSKIPWFQGMKPSIIENGSRNNAGFRVCSTELLFVSQKAFIFPENKNSIPSSKDNCLKQPFPMQTTNTKRKKEFGGKKKKKPDKQRKKKKENKQMKLLVEANNRD